MRRDPGPPLAFSGSSHYSRRAQSTRIGVRHGRTDQPFQLAHHPAEVSGRVAGPALRHRVHRGGSRQGADRNRQHLVRGQQLQHAPARPGREGEGGGRGGRGEGVALQHRRGVGRHVDGHRGDVVLAPVPRPHRGLHRDRDPRPVVRRPHHDPGVRQEHARVPDGDGPDQPAVDHGLRRHNPRRTHVERSGGGHRQRVPELRPVPRGQHRRWRTGRDRAQRLPRTRRVRGHVHREHHGNRDRGHGHVAALQFVHPGHGSRQARGMQSGRAPRCAR